LAYRIEPDSTHVSGEAASQSGRWAQTVRTPEGQVVQVQGRFTIDWRRDAGGRWRIARLHTQPASKIGELLPHRWTSEAT
jgi:ketosteroid isomerase-like protein